MCVRNNIKFVILFIVEILYLLSLNFSNQVTSWGLQTPLTLPVVPGSMPTGASHHSCSSRTNPVEVSRKYNKREKSLISNMRTSNLEKFNLMGGGVGVVCLGGGGLIMGDARS